MTTKAKFTVYKLVNEKVIEGLQKDGLKWFKPWKDSRTGKTVLNCNYVTRRPYNGVNVFLLNAIGNLNAYPTGEWLTFKEIQKIKGAKLIKGEKSTQIVFWSVFFVDEKGKVHKTDGEGREKKFSLRYYNVFNIAQCEGIKTKIAETPKEEEEKIKFTPIERAEMIYKNYVKAPKLTHVENSAYYSPTFDKVNMPKPENFIDSDSYYKTFFHELIHSTGHKNRLNRSTIYDSKQWGDKVYSKEELTAEIGAMYLVGLTDINPKDNFENSQAYLKGWIKHLKEHEKEATFAMQKAAQAIDYIIGEQ